MKDRVAPKVRHTKAQGAALGLRSRAPRSPERASLDGRSDLRHDESRPVGAYDQRGGAANPGLRPGLSSSAPLGPLTGRACEAAHGGCETVHGLANRNPTSLGVTRPC